MGPLYTKSYGEFTEQFPVRIKGVREVQFIRNTNEKALRIWFTATLSSPRVNEYIIECAGKVSMYGQRSQSHREHWRERGEEEDDEKKNRSEKCIHGRKHKTNEKHFF